MTKQEILDLNIELVGKGTEAEPYEVQTFKELITAINSYDENDQPSYVKIIEDINVSKEMKYFEDSLEFNNCCKLYSDDRKTISKLSIRSLNGIIKRGSETGFERIIDNIDFSNCTFLTGNYFYDYGGNSNYSIKINNCRFSAVVKNISSNVGSRLKLFYGNKQYLAINNCNFNLKLYGKFVLFSGIYMSDCNILLQSDDLQFCDSSGSVRLSYCGIVINNTVFKVASSTAFTNNPNNNYFVFNNCTTTVESSSSTTSYDVRFGNCTQTYYCLNNSNDIVIDPGQATLISSSDLKDVDKLFELGFLP